MKSEKRHKRIIYRVMCHLFLFKKKHIMRKIPQSPGGKFMTLFSVYIEGFL